MKLENIHQFFFKLLFLSGLTILIILSVAKGQNCSGSWATNHPYTYDCFTSEQFIGYQNISDAPGCPTNPIYTSTQTNTFTFDNPVSSFMFDFNAFSTAPACGRMEIKINGIFYHLTASNLTDIPASSNCTGSSSFLEITTDGYITGSAISATTENGQGRIIINNVNASSLTVSTNDAAGSLIKSPSACTSVVPIKLESFTGAGISSCKAILQWKTGVESNVKNIAVMRSNDGIIFNKVVDVLPKGSNSNYTIETNNYSDGFFKLMTIDLDGHFEYSEIIKVKSNCDKVVYEVSPNPTHNFIEVNGLKKDDKISLVDMLGRTVIRFNRLPVNNKFDIQQLAPGMYCLRIINGGVIKDNLKVIKN